jgi:rhodanese-related sulfurtransferase
MENINQSQWQQLIAEDSNAVILDVRTPGECAEGIQANAIQMNIQNTGKFIQDIDKLDKSKTYYVYCRSGGRSGQACMLMNAKGFKTYNLSGGMLNWTGSVVMP